ncbi:MAG TPA: VWA domain-containing protein [Thermoanaerobaculia bacterium]|nr:VWA domain-containing protein [Thermoanaerobaculia bacterium]
MRTAIAIGVAGALLGAGAVHGQDEATDRVFGETVEVRVVNVEAVVTDREGNRVSGLGPGDFRLLVDGEEVPIDYFSEISGGTAVAAAEDSDVPGVPVAAPGEPVGVNYLVFIDDYFSFPNDRNRILRTLAEDVDRLGPADQMTIVAFDGDRLDLLAEWTGKQRVLRAALEEAERRPAQGLSRRGELRAHDQLRERPSPRSDDRLQTTLPEDRMLAAQLRQEVARSIEAVASSLRYLGQPPGRKVALLLSGGWPISALAFAAGSPDTVIVDPGASGSDLLRPLLDAANLLGYTLYPVDVPGLRAETGADVERAGRVLDDTGVPLASDPAASLGVARERGRLETDSLYALAEATGGKAFAGGTSRQALEGVIEDLGAYYWIGFTPERRRDDRGHEIRLEVVDPALRIRSRAGFRDLSRNTEQQLALRGSLLFGVAGAGDGRPIEVAEVVPRGRKEAELSLVVRIPLDEVALIPEGNGWIGRLEVRAGAVDEKRRDSDLPGAPLELSFPQEPPAGAVYSLRVPLVVRRAPQTVIVQVTDTIGGRTLNYRGEVSP